MRLRGEARGASWLTAYERLLEPCLSRPRLTVALSAALIVASAYLALQLPREAIPASDEGRVEVRLALPPDADLELVDRRARELETRLSSWPEIHRVIADLGERDDARLELDPRPIFRGELTLVLTEGASAEKIARRVQELPRAADLELEARPVKPRLEALLGGEEADLVLDLLAAERGAAEEAAGPFLEKLAARSELANVARREAATTPAYRLELDRERAARFGLRSAAIQAHLETATRGREVTRLEWVNEEIPVVVRSALEHDVDELLAARVPTAAGLMPLATFVEAEKVEMTALLRRQGRGPTVRLTADVAEGSSLRAAVAAAEAEAGALPAGVRLLLGGALESFRASLGAVGKSLLLSVLLVFLILAAQFESLKEPWWVLAAVPMAAVGAVLALALTGQSWNLMSLTGLTVLVGIAVNDAIVKVDFIGRARRAGAPLPDALREAGRQRFRPIVMNTLTTGLGLLPLAFAWGPGGELQAPLAITILGGLLSATVLTLLALPALYLTFESREGKHATRIPSAE